MAKYALENIDQLIGISEYQLAKLYPNNLHNTLPTIEEIEAKLNEKNPRKMLILQNVQCKAAKSCGSRHTAAISRLTTMNN